METFTSITLRSKARKPIFSISVLVFLVGAAMASDDSERAKARIPERTQSTAATEFLVLPLRVIRLKSADVPEIDCRELSDEDIRRVVSKVNVIWASAGIHWLLESIDDLPAENTGRLKLAVKLDEEGLPDKAKGRDRKVRLPHSEFRRIIPESTRTDGGAYRVHFVHEFDVNGVYFGNREAMVKETAALATVQGGIDEPLPRVTAHELGHALGLPHRQDRRNLMASGTTGTTINDEEMRIAREFAVKNPACKTLIDLEDERKSAMNDVRKASIERALNSIRALADQRIHPVPAFDLRTTDQTDSPESKKP